jgi:hypothetical protein
MNIPDETECACCEQWVEVRAWDCHLNGFVCEECLILLIDAANILNNHGIETPTVKFPGAQG